MYWVESVWQLSHVSCIGHVFWLGVVFMGLAILLFKLSLWYCVQVTVGVAKAEWPSVVMTHIGGTVIAAIKDHKSLATGRWTC